MPEHVTPHNAAIEPYDPSGEPCYECGKVHPDGTECYPWMTRLAMAFCLLAIGFIVYMAVSV